MNKASLSGSLLCALLWSVTSGSAQDAGYRNWLYLLTLGEPIGSKDRIAYLADDAFMNDRQYDISRNPTEAIKPFYDAATIAGACFLNLQHVSITLIAIQMGWVAFIVIMK